MCRPARPGRPSPRGLRSGGSPGRSPRPPGRRTATSGPRWLMMGIPLEPRTSRAARRPERHLSRRPAGRMTATCPRVCQKAPIPSLIRQPRRSTGRVLRGQRQGPAVSQPGLFLIYLLISAYILKDQVQHMRPERSPPDTDVPNVKAKIIRRLQPRLLPWQSLKFCQGKSWHCHVTTQAFFRASLECCRKNSSQCLSQAEKLGTVAS